MNKILTINSFFVSSETGFFVQFINKTLLKKKTKAFTIHLFLSALLLSSFFYFAVSYWFPIDTLQLSGVNQVLMIILLVDLILGPSLTFLVFNPDKKSLKFDLLVIVIMQLAMFCYGAYTVFQAHPVYITFTVDRFILVPARDANPVEAVYDEYHTSRFAKPLFAYVESPKETEKRNKVLFESVLGGLDLDAHAEYYLPYQDNKDKIIKKGLPIDDIFVNEEQKQSLATFLQEKNLDIKDLVFIPVQGKAKFMTYAVAKTSAKPLGVFDIDPWKNFKTDSLQQVSKLDNDD